VRIEGLSDAELALRPHRVRGPVANALFDRGAIFQARAVAYEPDSADAARDLTRLRSSGLVKSTLDGRCWFDLRAFYVLRAHQARMRAMIALPVAIVLAIFTVSFYPG
jgi:hypothetical protein